MNFKKLSKNQMDRLAKELAIVYSKNEKPSEEQLEQLQCIRIDYKDALKVACEELTKILNKVDSDGIITYRVKRIESICSKIERALVYDDNHNLSSYTSLTNMQDIAGARCILSNEYKIDLFFNEIKKSNILTYKKHKDYIQEPKENGYRSIHVICKCLDTTIEIQLRDNTQHAWGTLVEITDQLFKTKLKEYNNDFGTGLYDFLRILSKQDSLTVEERKIVLTCLMKNKFIQKLTTTFTKNAIKLRKHWIQKKEIQGQFYLFIVNKRDKPEIIVYDSFEEAEKEYFNNFNPISEKNMVMAYISESRFDKISKAYSNYILIKHDFYDKLIEILSSTTEDSKLNAMSFTYLKLLMLCKMLVHVSELQVLSGFYEIKNYNNKLKEWKKEVFEEVHNQKNYKYPDTFYETKLYRSLEISKYELLIRFKLRIGKFKFLCKSKYVEYMNKKISKNK